MFNVKVQSLRKLTYICLSCSSIIFTEELLAMDDPYDRESYRALHNRMADKYTQGRHRLPPRTSPQAPGLGERAEQFNRAATTYRRTLEERDQELNNLGTQAIEGGRALAENFIDDKVKDAKTKGILKRLCEAIANLLLGCFR